LGPCEMQLLGRISSQVELMESAAQTLLTELESNPDNFCTTLADTPLPETIEFSEQEQQNYADLYAVFGPDGLYGQGIGIFNRIEEECTAGGLSVTTAKFQLQSIDISTIQGKLREYDNQIFLELNFMEQMTKENQNFFLGLQQGESLENLEDHCTPVPEPNPIQSSQEQRAVSFAYETLSTEGYNRSLGALIPLNEQRLDACKGSTLAPEDINSAITQLEDVRASLQTIKDSLAPLGTIECRVEQ